MASYKPASPSHVINIETTPRLPSSVAHHQQHSSSYGTSSGDGHHHHHNTVPLSPLAQAQHQSGSGSVPLHDVEMLSMQEVYEAGGSGGHTPDKHHHHHHDSSKTKFLEMMMDLPLPVGSL